LAGALGVLGGFGHFAIGMFCLFALGLPGGDRAEMAAYIDRLNATPALVAIVFPLILCFGLGVVALAWAAWRTALVGLWGPVTVTVVVVLHALLPSNEPFFEVAGLGVIAVVFGYLGVQVAQLTDTDWSPVPPARAMPEAAAV
jgi:hypothetical protein